MRKLLKYMKQSWVAILIVFGALLIQAFCDLALPTYTSNIVNVGIQQGGIEELVPEQIRETEMEKLLLFIPADQQNTVLEAYVLEDGVYHQGELEEEAEEILSGIMVQPMFLVMSFESGGEEVTAMMEEMTGAMPESAADLDIFEVFMMLPEETLEEIRQEIAVQFAQMPESIIEQGAISYIGNEYDALGVDAEQRQNRYLFSTGGKMLLVALISMTASIFVGFMAARIAASTSRNLRSQVFKKVISFSNTEFDRFSTASLITRSTNDVQQVQMLIVMMLRMVLYAPMLGIGGVIRIMNTNTEMAWIIGLAVALILVLVGFLFWIVMPKFRIMQKLVDRVNLVTREILTGLPVIRAFSRERHEEKRFAGANNELMKTQLFVNRVMAGMMPMMMLVMNGITLLIVYNGAYSIDAGAMQVGDMMAFIQYSMQIIMAFLMICMVSIMLPRASVSATRLDEVLSTEAVVRNPERAAPLDDGSKKGVVEFRHVSFRYPGADEDVLHDIDFTAKPGETTAIIGSTGSGKSTLINLIPRFYDVTEGEVLVDGVDVRKVTQHDLRDKIGYVPQKGVLFSGTIASNITFGNPEASETEMAKAAEIAQASDFISKKEEAYESHIAQGGANVSGGQKQRLSIARAIAKHPEVYIFDDSFSALDYKTDVALRSALKEETAESTVLIVAQRISTILHAEQIIVLDEGKIAGHGTHEELLKDCEVYRQIAMSQLSEEELSTDYSAVAGKEVAEDE